MKKSKLTIEKFKISELSNQSKIIGGGDGDLTIKPKDKCQKGSEVIIN